MTSAVGDNGAMRMAHATRTWPEIDAATETLLVPVGSTEQHGPHLPLDTDTRVAAAVARQAAAQRASVVVAPALPYGSSGEHQGFDGTLSIGTDSLATVLVELGRSALPPFRHLVMVNGHGGNADAVAIAIDTLTSEGRAVSTWWPTLDSAHPQHDAHAGFSETSLLLHLCPDFVRRDRAEPGNTRPITELVPRLAADGVRVHSPNGVLGDPTGATSERGEELFDELVASLVSHLDRVGCGRILP